MAAKRTAPENQSLDRLFTLEEVAAALGFSRVHVRRLIKAGKLVGINLNLDDGSRPTWRFRQSDVDAFLNARQVNTR